jgi:hypothetical protein
MKWDEVTALLVRARARIADPRRWTTGVFALDLAERRVSPWNPLAVRWCAVGALKVEAAAGLELGRTGGEYRRLLRGAMERLRRALPRPRRVDDAEGDVMGFNDERGHAAVLTLFDEAIRRK